MNDIAARAVSTTDSGQFNSYSGVEGQALPTRRALSLGLPAAALGAALAPRAWARPAPTPALDWPPAPAPLAARHARAFAGWGARIEAQLTDVQSLVVLHQGHLAFEHYRAGLTAASLQDTQSVTKSVLALLAGQALAAGRLRGVDELVANRLPEMLRMGADERVRRLRIAHLLGMTAGWPPDQTARRDRDDDLRALVRRPFQAEPGARFAYDNGAANLLALALARALGRPLHEHARDHLFAPLGIQRFAWRQGAHGHALGALGLSLPARAMARLGELVLAQGQWRGRALLPAGFVQQATSRQNAGGPPLDLPYGHLWWVAHPVRGAASARPVVMANGYGGQWIWIDAARDLVVAATSRRTPESMARAQAATLIRRDLAAALDRYG